MKRRKQLGHDGDRGDFGLVVQFMIDQLAAVYRMPQPNAYLETRSILHSERSLLGLHHRPDDRHASRRNRATARFRP